MGWILLATRRYFSSAPWWNSCYQLDKSFAKEKCADLEEVHCGGIDASDGRHVQDDELVLVTTVAVQVLLPPDGRLD